MLNIPPSDCCSRQPQEEERVSAIVGREVKWMACPLSPEKRGHKGFHPNVGFSSAHTKTRSCKEKSRHLKQRTSNCRKIISWNALMFLPIFVGVVTHLLFVSPTAELCFSNCVSYSSCLPAPTLSWVVPFNLEVA